MVDVSVIGCGHMGGALVRGLATTGHQDICVCDVDPAALRSVEDLGVITTTIPAEAAEADVIFVAVKPALVGVVLDELDLEPTQTVVSIAAGVSTSFVREHTAARVVRLMPNLAAEWGAMATAVTGDEIDDELITLLSAVGSVVELPESQMDTATAVNGSGPAFVFYLIQAMTEAGVEGGIDPDDARVLAAQTFKGAAEIVLQSDASIEELIDAVCSPKGTTIEGMAVLRESDIDTAIRDAVMAAERRATELSMEVSS